MATQFVLGTTIILATVTLHIAGLVMLSLALSRVGLRLEHLARPVVIAALLAPSVFSILLLHTAEA